MPAIGKVTETRIGGAIVVTDESGESYTFRERPHRPLLFDIDPRIDLTKPIYDQVAALDATDKASDQPAEQHSPHDRVA